MYFEPRASRLEAMGSAIDTTWAGVDVVIYLAKLLPREPAPMMRIRGGEGERVDITCRPGGIFV